MVYRVGPYCLDSDKFELTHNGRAVPVEPQVLSVILHLISQRDHVVTRDGLVDAIWQGRAISDAAIASRIKSARRALGDNGHDQRVIRTVHGRGFRFVAPVSEEVQASAGSPKTSGRIADRQNRASLRAAEPAPATRHAMSRRGMLAAAAAGTGTAILGGAAWWTASRRTKPVPQEVATLVFRAREAMAQNTRAGHFQAIGILRRVVEVLPAYADGWGMLGMAYGIPSHYSERSQALDLQRRGEAAAGRALELHPGNGFGELARGILTPFVGHYWKRREHMRKAVAALPGNPDALTYQAVSLQFDGYPAAAVAVYQRISERPMTPALYNNYIRALWSAGRGEEADRATADALALYPTQNSLWITRYYRLLFSERAGEAQAQLEDRANWPAGFDQSFFRILAAQTEAIRSRDPALIAKVVDEQLAEARKQMFEAENAVRVLAALGRVDEAFRVAEAYFFGRGFVIPDFAGLGSVASPEQRQTRWLFEPVTAPLRRDFRFERLVRDLGFHAYWKKVGIAPDYQRLAIDGYQTPPNIS